MVIFWIDRLLAASAARCRPWLLANRDAPPAQTHVAWLSDPSSSQPYPQSTPKLPIRSRRQVVEKQAHSRPRTSVHYDVLRNVLRIRHRTTGAVCLSLGDQNISAWKQVWRMRDMPICCRIAPVPSVLKIVVARGRRTQGSRALHGSDRNCQERDEMRSS
jgi:hypothetical protein